MKKKLLALLLAGCMVLSLSACGSEEAKDTTDTEETAETEDTAELDTSALGTSTIKKLGEYMGLSYVPYDTTVTDEELEAEVQYMLANSFTEKPQEVVTETSYVNIDYVGTKDGVAFDGGTAESQELSIENSGYIDGFAESIVGMKVGETKDCPMTFPEDYGVEELNGADVVFTITVNECWEQVPAELNDEFAVSQGYENLDALYAGVKELYEAHKAETAESDKEYQLLQGAINNSEFDITEEEIALYIDDLESEYEYYASYYGYDLETYVNMSSGLSMSEFEEQCREIAIYRIQCPLLLSAIAEAEGLELTDEEYNTRAQEYVEYYGYTTIEELEEAYTKETVVMQLTSDMALDLIVENSVAGE